MRRLKPIVLAAEDDPEFRGALELVLGRFGLQAAGAANAEEFLAAAEKLKPDLYLVDLQLGAQSGLDLIEELRERRDVKEPILVVSGGRNPEQVAHALELGANDYVMKPLDRAFLAAKLSQYLEAEQLEAHRAEYREVPKGKSPSRLEFGGEVVEVDELGVRLRTTTLVPKGTVLKLRCAALAQAGVPGGEALVSVVSTELDSAAKVYRVYLEFDGVDVDFMQTIRRWLAS